MMKLPPRAFLFIALALALAAPAHAGLRYHFTTLTRTGPYETRSAGTMLVGNNSYRLELEPDRTGVRDFDVVISRDGDMSASLINLKTGETRPRPSPIGRVVSSRLFLLPYGLDSRVGGEIAVKVASAPGDIVAGVATVKHAIDLTYRIYSGFAGTPITADVHAIVNVWMAPSLPALPMQRAVTSGFAEVDAALAQASAGMRGMTMRHELTVTRSIDGGPAMSESVATTIDSLAVASITSASFALPTGIAERVDR